MNSELSPIGLSLPGGGVRGIVQLTLLERLTSEFEETIPELFPNVTSNSTGSMTAALLYSPGESGRPKYTVHQGIQMYPQTAATVFQRTLWQKITNPWSLFAALYSRDNLKAVSRATTGNRPLHELLGRDVTMLAYDFPRRKMETLSSLESLQEDSLSAALDLETATFASTAAPDYFPSVNFSHGGRFYSLVDGGVGANDPSFYCFSRIPVEQSKRVLITVGTGRIDSEAEPAGNWGVLRWAPKGVETLMEGTLSACHEPLTELLGDWTHGRYFYIEPPLPPDLMRWDNPSPSNIQELRQVTLEYLEDEGEAIMRAAIKAVRTHSRHQTK